jgi:hypothetical protein
MVIARYNENLDWVFQMPSEINYQIYNKGDYLEMDTDKLPFLSLHQGMRNSGREGGTYLSYLIDHYDSIPDIVIFTQAKPQDHSPNFSNLVYKIVNNSFEGNFMPLSMWYTHNMPPRQITKPDQNLYYIETANRFTLAPIYHWDHGIGDAYHKYLNSNRDCKMGDDVVHHFCSMMKIPDHDYGTITFNFSYSGIFAVKKEAILKYSRSFYLDCFAMINKEDCYGYFFERIWMMLFKEVE